jgi:hypothetical protein
LSTFPIISTLNPNSAEKLANIVRAKGWAFNQVYATIREFLGNID